MKSRTILMDKLQSYLPPSIMLPPRRLQVLLSQAIELQAQKCSYHNTTIGMGLETVSLLVDHCCSQEDFPSHCVQVQGQRTAEIDFFLRSFCKKKYKYFNDERK